jgi:hypothetical protein
MTSVLASLALLLQVATNAELGYRFTLPEGFGPFPEGRSQQDVVDCWTEVAAAAPSGALVLCVQRMRATLGRERLRPQDAPASTQLRTFKWQGFELDGIRSDTAQSGMPVVMLATQVPLRHEAIQLIVAGPRDQGQRAEAIMTSVLGTLEGETNWLSSEERAGRLGNIVGWVVGIAVAVVLIRLWRARRQSRAA